MYAEAMAFPNWCVEEAKSRLMRAAQLLAWSVKRTDERAYRAKLRAALQAAAVELDETEDAFYAEHAKVAVVYEAWFDLAPLAGCFAEAA